MVDALPIELRKIAYRQSAKDGLVITFAVHPNDMPADLAAAPIGARFMAALVEIGDDEQPVKKEQNSVVQRAGILCNDPQFHQFLQNRCPNHWNEAGKYGASDSAVAAEALRAICNIQSRKELASSPEAQAAFDKLGGRFEVWKRGLS